MTEGLRPERIQAAGLMAHDLVRRDLRFSLGSTTCRQTTDALLTTLAGALHMTKVGQPAVRGVRLALCDWRNAWSQTGCLYGDGCHDSFGVDGFCWAA
jgi:hypothetical protein